MAHLKFDLSKIAKLDDPGRFETMVPEVMWRALGDPRPAMIIEIGAGTGLFAQRFSEIAEGAVVFAVDTEQPMLDWMHEYRPGVATGAVVPVLSTETSVPLPDGEADVVMLLNVHHELSDPAAIYAEALRLLRPGGQVLVVDWAPLETPKGPPVEIRVSGETIAALLGDAGFLPASVDDEALAWHTMVTAVRP